VLTRIGRKIDGLTFSEGGEELLVRAGVEGFVHSTGQKEGGDQVRTGLKD
jgi:hypothetical protein